MTSGELKQIKGGRDDDSRHIDQNRKKDLQESNNHGTHREIQRR